VNQQQMMRQIAQMQQKMQEVQEELGRTEVTGSSGGGLVTVTATALGEFRGVRIDPKAVDPDDVEMLEDLVLAAISEAKKAGEALQSSQLGSVTGGLSIPGLM
jgi:DNA-binding YbaB/EbfC family protein